MEDSRGDGEQVGGQRRRCQLSLKSSPSSSPSAPACSPFRTFHKELATENWELGTGNDEELRTKNYNQEQRTRTKNQEQEPRTKNQEQEPRTKNKNREQGTEHRTRTKDKNEEQQQRTKTKNTRGGAAGQHLSTRPIGPSYRMNVPLRRSSIAWTISARVFMTIGPCQATGSSIGLPDTSRNLIPWSPA
jgi:hypothetical protein